MARARQTTTPSASASSPSKGKKVVKASIPEPAPNVITDEPLLEQKKPAARKATPSKDAPPKDGNKVYKLVEGSVACREGPDISTLPISKDIYTLTFPATSPVNAAKKAFAKIYKTASPTKKGASTSDKPDSIVYNLVIVDVASGKHFPYIASHTRRAKPSVVKKGDGVIQWEADGTTRVKTWPSAHAAGEALGGDCESVEDLQKSHPDFKWTPSIFTSNFETNVKAFKSTVTSEEASSSVDTSSSPSSSEAKETITKKKLPQSPKKPTQTVNVPLPASESEEKPKPKGRAPPKKAEELPQKPASTKKVEETQKPASTPKTSSAPPKGRARAK